MDMMINVCVMQNYKHFSLIAKLKDLKLKVAIFASYEETGSKQATGCQTHVIDDFFLELIGGIKMTRFLRNSFMLSARNVCAAYESRRNTKVHGRH